MVNEPSQKIIEKHENQIIYFTNTEETTEKQETHVKKKSKKIEPTKYITPVIISLLIYLLCAWASKVGFSEIIDMEIPLIILLTLILTESIFQGYSKISIPLYVIGSALCYFFINNSFALFITISLTSVLISICLNRIYYNPNDYCNRTDDEISIKSIFSRVKYHIFLAFILFTVFLLLGYYYPSLFQSLVMPSVENLHNGVQDGSIQLETLSLFTNNFSVALGIILGGFYFSTYSIYMLIYNAIFIGFSGAITSIKYFLAFTVPHGILELSGIILAGATSLRITHAFLVLLNGIKLNEKNRREIFTNSLNKFIKMFIDVGLLIIIICVMLLIAAFIEANLTITIGTYLYNI